MSGNPNDHNDPNRQGPYRNPNDFNDPNRPGQYPPPPQWNTSQPEQPADGQAPHYPPSSQYPVCCLLFCFYSEFFFFSFLFIRASYHVFLNLSLMCLRTPLACDAALIRLSNGALANLDAIFTPLVSSGFVPSNFISPDFLSTTRALPACTWAVSASAEHGSYPPSTVAGPLPHGTPSRLLPPPRHVQRTPSASSSLPSCCSPSADCHRVSLLPETEGTFSRRFCQMAPFMGRPSYTRSQLTLFFPEPIDSLLGI